MKAQTSRGLLSIRWQYGKCEKQVVRSGGEETVEQQCTSCFLTDTATGDIVSEGVVRRYVTDPDDKVVARKESLKKALKDFSKEDKSAIWGVVAENVKLG